MTYPFSSAHPPRPSSGADTQALIEQARDAMRLAQSRIPLADFADDTLTLQRQRELQRAFAARQSISGALKALDALAARVRELEARAETAENALRDAIEAAEHEIGRLTREGRPNGALYFSERIQSWRAVLAGSRPEAPKEAPRSGAEEEQTS